MFALKATLQTSIRTFINLDMRGNSFANLVTHYYLKISNSKVYTDSSIVISGKVYGVNKHKPKLKTLFKMNSMWLHQKCKQKLAKFC